MEQKAMTAMFENFCFFIQLRKRPAAADTINRF